MTLSAYRMREEASTMEVGDRTNEIRQYAHVGSF